MHFKVNKLNNEYYFKSGDEIKGFCRFVEGTNIIDVYVRHSISGQYFHYTNEPEYNPNLMNDEKYLVDILSFVGRYIAKYFLKVTVELE